MTVWAIRSTSDGNLYWSNDGSTISGILTPPDPDSFWYAGGSDGRSIFMAAISQTSPHQWYVDVFDSALATLTDQWTVTGWVDAQTLPLPSWTAGSDQQALCADASHVVLIADKRNAAHTAIDVTVFDTAGTLLDQWSHATTDELSAFTGSCTDGASVFFGYIAGSDEAVASVDLAAGTFTQLFLIADVDAAILALDGTWPGLTETHGIVTVAGDLIIAGIGGVARVQSDGTPVWWQPLTSGAFAYRGLAHSGRGSVWAADDFFNVDEYRLDTGALVQTITLPEYAAHAWLVAARGGWFVDFIGS